MTTLYLGQRATVTGDTFSFGNATVDFTQATLSFAEGSLSSQIGVEQARAESAESALGSRIDNVVTALGTDEATIQRISTAITTINDKITSDEGATALSFSQLQDSIRGNTNDLTTVKSILAPVSLDSNGKFTISKDVLCNSVTATETVSSPYIQGDNVFIKNLNCEVGQTSISITCPVSISGYKITNLAVGTDSTDAVNLSQIQTLQSEIDALNQQIGWLYQYFFQTPATRNPNPSS